MSKVHGAARLDARQCAVVLALLAWTSCCPAADLGRLFFTVEQRVVLEQQRRHPVSRPRNDVWHLDGVVSRAGQRSTLWLNGKPQYQAMMDGHVAVDPDDTSRVALRVGPGQSVYLRVGEAPQ